MNQTIKGILTVSVLALFGCAPDRPDGWEEDSHGSDAEANYALLFPETPTVHRFDFTIDADDCTAAQEDLADKLSGGGPGAEVDEDPIFVPATMQFGDKSWHYVGIRYKGNSSLRSAYQSGIRKLALRLNFEMFEEDYPEVQNQRFYGFEKMTFSNGFNDDSLMRDKLAAEIFRNGGVPVARSSFAQVYVDCGEGSTYWGLYTMIEDPSDEMLKDQFGDGDGNLYKPEDDGAMWNQARFSTDDFYKKTNLDSDWSDINAVMSALHADLEPEAWRSNLSAVFNVDGFLRVLALNQVMVNWDSYGCMPHNYYLYADASDDGRITWFPWDLNESLLMVDNRRCAGATSITLDEITAEWPMIRNLLDDPVYQQRYKDEMQSALAGGFESASVLSMIETYHDLISPYVVGPEAEEASPYTFLTNRSDFTTAVSGATGLNAHVEAQHAVARQALGI